MTYRTERRLVGAGVTAVSSALFLLVPFAASRGVRLAAALAFGAATFLALYVFREAAFAALDRSIYRRRFRKTETRIVLSFAERVGASFTILDLVDAIREYLEKPADMSALLIRSNTWELIYQSPTATATDPRVLEALEKNFRDWSEGFSFISEDFSITSSNEGARGFFVYAKGFHLFVLTRLCPLIELEAFRTLYGELSIYFDRVITISDLFKVAELSREWQLVAATQRSFLPKNLPQPRKLELAVAYRPLINVSGDYYDAIAVDENRTLLVVGDVSGKGLAAALIMGIIVNTIRVAPDKADLAALVRAVDAAIRDMGFDDKYTVMFLGLVDTAARSFRYVNAAMADPILVAQTALGPKIRRLEPTMGLIGLVPIEGEIRIEEMPLRTDEIIFLASDGVTEVADTRGRRLGETEEFDRAILQAAKQPASEFVGSITSLIYGFIGDAELKDDVTILAAKAGRLWD